MDDLELGVVGPGLHQPDASRISPPTSSVSDSLEDDLETKRKELEEALAEASRVLRRNSADQGLEIEEIRQRLATLWKVSSQRSA